MGGGTEPAAAHHPADPPPAVFLSQVGLPIQEASLGCPRHHPSPASPPTSHPSPTSHLQAACSSCGVLSTTTTRRSLRTFSPRQSILKPEWRLWWPFRWQDILRGQVSDEATRDLPKFVIFCESESFLCTLSIVYHYHMQFLKRPVGESTRKDMFFFHSEIKADKES